MLDVIAFLITEPFASSIMLFVLVQLFVKQRRLCSVSVQADTRPQPSLCPERPLLPPTATLSAVMH